MLLRDYMWYTSPFYSVYDLILFSESSKVTMISAAPLTLTVEEAKPVVRYLHNNIIYVYITSKHVDTLQIAGLMFCRDLASYK